ncbi:hypothetical protein SDRG_08269 [Saprolegnia diclina VS20]|uniref:Uncharacterized protein n=1 Tax=Saprolegnia diclina (strain VS20) TaxID=1156394 RepID=T0QJX8_SAPDV|nr:hypothetical protein SDRG_08269 [Saprolegnia diclina VS20]EQC34055.1 hypothetical protein SDRG_08269 [Saprolegnia diclina VS20]|eukprot:XP_008612367.1 hypothetical protein SDRG_08269 [Saprolegnia diclina VS20]
MVKRKADRDGSAKRKKERVRPPRYAPVEEESEAEFIAAQKHALHLIQAGQTSEANKFLARRGFTHRLATCVLRYTYEEDLPPPSADAFSFTAADYRPYVRGADNALPPTMLHFMQDAFASSDSPFWAAHQYSVDPPSPYFSYVHDLSKPPSSGLEDVIHYLKNLAMERFPNVKNAKFAEWWTHCRPHHSGHQFHFDSADEGRDGVRNPIVSTVMFLEAPVGGPTCVSDQAFGGTSLAKHGWLVHPKENRFVVFNGKVLHGVVPGRGPGRFSLLLKPRRVTFMVAFWEIDVRKPAPAPGARPSSAMPLNWKDDADAKTSLTM